MCFKALNWAYGLPLKGRCDKAVLVYLANMARSNGVCWPKIASIVKAVPYGERSVRYSLRSLERWGLLEFIPHPDDKRQNCFRLTKIPAPLDEQLPAIQVCKQPANSNKGQSDNTGNQEQEYRQSTSEIPAIYSIAYIDEPLENHERTTTNVEAHAVGVVKMPTARDRLWSVGLPTLQAMTGMPAKPVRTMLGKLLKDAKDDCALVLAVLSDAEEVRPIDPIPWLRAAIQSRADGREGVLEKLAREVNFTMFDLPSASDFDEEGNWIHGDQGQTSDGAFLAHDA